MSARFQTGIDVLLSRHRGWLSGRRVGLLSHTAAVDGQGCASAERLWADADVDLACLMAPEHGFFGRAGAGESCRTIKHPAWGIPVFSLYGATRMPTPAMLKHVDTIVFDLQDIGCRAYTYVSTLRLLLDAAATHGKRVIVADRPVPLPAAVDGPITEPGFESFVSQIPSPLSYGMTPGETATWLCATDGLELDLRVARMRGYTRQPERPAGGPPWIPPSPAMRSWESAACFPVTVCMEGLGSLDHGRRTNLPFQLFGARWTRGTELAAALNARGLAGIRFFPHAYLADPRSTGERPIDGVRMTITAAGRLRPALAAVTILRTLQDLYGARRVWAPKTSRPAFFDKLWGTDAVRRMLRNGAAPAEIAAAWKPGLRRFRRERATSLLYGRKGEA